MRNRTWPSTFGRRKSKTKQPAHLEEQLPKVQKIIKIMRNRKPARKIIGLTYFQGVKGVLNESRAIAGELSQSFAAMFTAVETSFLVRKGSVTQRRVTGSGNQEFIARKVISSIPVGLCGNLCCLGCSSNTWEMLPAVRCCCWWGFLTQMAGSEVNSNELWKAVTTQSWKIGKSNSLVVSTK